MLCILIQLHVRKDIQDQLLRLISHQDLNKNGIDFIYPYHRHINIQNIYFKFI